MLNVNEDQFELLVSDAIDAIPEKYFKKIKHILIIIHFIKHFNSMNKIVNGTKLFLLKNQCC